jgi:type IV pilus assembly protein PilM
MANIFSNIIDSFFSKKSVSVLGVDIGSSSIKVVQLRRKSGRAILETYGELSLGPYASGNVGQATNLPVEKIVEAMNDILNEKEVKITTRLCGVAIPFTSSLMSVIEMPIVSPKELARMVPIEARKYIPAPMSEVVLDWSVIPKDKSSESNEEPRLDGNGKPMLPKMEVMIVALHNNTIEKYKEIVDKSHLDAGFFEIEIFSTIRSILDQEINPVMFLDMGATSTKLYIVERGILRSSHIITRGGQGVTTTLSKSLGISMQDAEVLKREKGLLGVAGGVGVGDVITVTVDYIFSEANQVVLAYQKKYRKNCQGRR